MKIRTRFIVFGIYICLVTFLLIYLQFKMFRSVINYSNIYQNTIKSSAIARQYQQNSAYLTQFIRSYVATGNEKYERAYNDCIAISGGNKAAPLNYDRGLYWSLYLGSGNKPYQDGETKSYSDIMRDLNFTKDMFDYLLLSKQRSEELVKLEMRAMNIIKSIPKNADGVIAPEYKERQLEAIELVNGDEYEKRVSEIMVPINQFFDLLENNNNMALQSASNNVKKDTILFFIVLLSVGISIAIFLIFLAKIIGKNLGLCVNLASEISSGNLTSKIDESLLKRNDEFASLLRSFNNMMSNLRDIIVNVLDSSKEIADATTEIAQGNTDLSTRTEMQASSLEETASSMEQIASTIKSSADNSLRGNHMMQDSEKAVQEAGEIIEATTNNIELVYDASNKITDIIKIIENIAFQTNILALNAAVEAARAGEQGKGFAVVASEIRSLAQNVDETAKNITDTINEALTKVDIGNKAVEKSSKILEDIEALAQDMLAKLTSISQRAVVEADSINQINVSVRQLNSITGENSTLAESNANSTKEVRTKIEDMADQINSFKF